MERQSKVSQRGKQLWIDFFPASDSNRRILMLNSRCLLWSKLTLDYLLFSNSFAELYPEFMVKNFLFINLEYCCSILGLYLRITEWHSSTVSNDVSTWNFTVIVCINLQMFERWYPKHSAMYFLSLENNNPNSLRRSNFLTVISDFNLPLLW